MPKKASLQETHPELAAQWHPAKNGDLTFKDVTAGSDKDVWWLLPYDDPKTGKHFDFEWHTKICDRTRGNDCPFLSGKAVWPGFNDLMTTNPDIAVQWHPVKNGDLTSKDVTAKCNKKVWWLLPYDDPKTGNHFDFEWRVSVAHRTQGIDCPYLSGKAVWPGFNDLMTTNPDIAAQWHPVKNGDLAPRDVTAGSHKKVWWFLPYDDPMTGNHFDFEWQASIRGRIQGNNCPYLSGKAVWPGFNDLMTTNPDIAAQWHPVKNGDLAPRDVTAGSGKRVWWLLPYDDPMTGEHFDFEWRTSTAHRTNGRDCPFLTGNAVWPGFNDLMTTNPDIAAQWHPVKNRKLTPERMSAGSGIKVWWRCDTCGHAWRMSILTRTSLGSGCPKCGGHRTGE